MARYPFQIIRRRVRNVTTVMVTLTIEKMNTRMITGIIVTTIAHLEYSIISKFIQIVTVRTDLKVHNCAQNRLTRRRSGKRKIKLLTVTLTPKIRLAWCEMIVILTMISHRTRKSATIDLTGRPVSVAAIAVNRILPKTSSTRHKRDLAATAAMMTNMAFVRAIESTEAEAGEVTATKNRDW